MTTILSVSDPIYPDSDGQPMSDNTKQFYWIVLIKENLEILFADDPQVFVAGDLLWYPVQGRPDVRVAPDVIVAFGRPKGDRGSYKQWEEGNITPQVVFEILSPGNTVLEMSKKLLFYEHYGIQEYYLYDPDQDVLGGFIRGDENTLEAVDELQSWISPRLGIRFELTDSGLVVFQPSGKPFLSPVELSQLAIQEEKRAEVALLQAEAAQTKAEAAQAQVTRLAARLRELGIDPE
jgi:Uma2 family endonuclease